jgi:DNA-binding response OmpR family regulator
MSTIFLADTESPARRLIEKVLADEDFTVQSVSTGRALLDKIRSSPPDLVILDVALPGTDGKSLIEKMRSDAPQTQVLVMARADEAEADADVLEGATEYIAKPINPSELRVRVRRALRQPQGLAVPGAELHDTETGRLDAKLIAKAIGVKLAQLTAPLKVDYKALHKTPDAPALQEALQPIKEAVVLIARFTRSPEDTRKWLNSPHPDLGKKTPLDAILRGRASAVVTILENALTGISS